MPHGDSYRKKIGPGRNPTLRLVACQSLESRRYLAGNPTVIDVMVVYTRSARDAAGGDAIIQSLIQGGR